MKGGRRPGAGRPKVAEKRKQRPIRFYDGEWALIANNAKKRGMQIREYLYWLAEKDDASP